MCSTNKGQCELKYSLIDDEEMVMYANEGAKINIIFCESYTSHFTFCGVTSVGYADHFTFCRVTSVGYAKLLSIFRTFNTMLLWKM